MQYGVGGILQRCAIWGMEGVRGRVSGGVRWWWTIGRDTGVGGARWWMFGKIDYLCGIWGDIRFGEFVPSTKEADGFFCFTELLKPRFGSVSFNLNSKL